MTLRIILLFGLMAVILSCGTQNNFQSYTTNDLPKEFFKRWKLDYGTMNGKRVSGFISSPDKDYLFKDDGTYINYSTVSDNTTGNWEYNETEKSVYTRRKNGEINGIIKDIKTNSFILIPPKKSVKNTPLTSLIFYYIPVVE